MYRFARSPLSILCLAALAVLSLPLACSSDTSGGGANQDDDDDDDNDDDDNNGGDDDDDNGGDDDDEDVEFPEGLIDNMEDGDSSIAYHEERDGFWDKYDDETPKGTMTLEVEDLPEEREDSTKGVHITAEGFTEWGSGAFIQFVLEPEKNPVYDVSKYEGVRMWVKLGETEGAEAKIRFNVADTQTDPRGGECMDGYRGIDSVETGEDESGSESASEETSAEETASDDESSAQDSSGDETGSDDGTQDDTETSTMEDDKEACFSHFGQVIELSAEWTEIEIKWEDLKQDDWGKQFDKLATESVYSFEFSLPHGKSYDFWVDDISFF
jgi:hypothetical protein